MNGQGHRVEFKNYPDLDSECTGICKAIKDLDYGKVAILTRTNNNARDFEQHLILNDIPYELHPSAHKFMQRKEIKVSLAYLLMLEHPNDNVALQTVLESTDGFGEVVISRLMAIVSTIKPLYEICVDAIRGVQMLAPKIDAKQTVKHEIDELKFSKVQKENLSNVFNTIQRYKEAGTDKDKLLVYLTSVGCLAYVTKYAEQNERDPMKLVKNVEILLDIVAKFDTLEAFYTHVALQANDTKTSPDIPSVRVLTIHSSKGLEYDYVFLP